MQDDENYGNNNRQFGNNQSRGGFSNNNWGNQQRNFNNYNNQPRRNLPRPENIPIVNDPTIIIPQKNQAPFKDPSQHIIA